MSPTSFQTALSRYKINGRRRIRTFEGSASRFTVCPLWPLGNPPKIYIDNKYVIKADSRSRTNNLLITNQLLCQLSHIGTICIILTSNGAYRARTYDPLLVRQMLSQLSYDPILYLHFYTKKKISFIN